MNTPIPPLQPQPDPQDKDTIIVRLNPASPIAQEAAEDLKANARLRRIPENQLLAKLLQHALGSAFQVRAAS